MQAWEKTDPQLRPTQDEDRNSAALQETLAELSDYWAATTLSLKERDRERVERALARRSNACLELKEIERRLQVPQRHFEFARLCARLTKLYSKLMRDAVLEVKFGVGVD